MDGSTRSRSPGHSPDCACESCFARSSASREEAEGWYRLTQRASDEHLAPDLVGIMGEVLELGKQIGRRELLAEMRRRRSA